MEGEPWGAFALPPCGVGIGLEVLFPAKILFDDGACRHAPVFLQKNSSSCLEAGEVTEMIVDLGGRQLVGGGFSADRGEGWGLFEKAWTFASEKSPSA